MKINPVLFGAVKRPNVDYQKSDNFNEGIVRFKHDVWDAKRNNGVNSIVFRVLPVDHFNVQEQQSFYLAVDDSDSPADLETFQGLLKGKKVLAERELRPGEEPDHVHPSRDAYNAMLEQARLGTPIAQDQLMLRISPSSRMPGVAEAYYILNGGEVTELAKLVEKSGTKLIPGKHYLSPNPAKFPKPEETEEAERSRLVLEA